MSPSSATHDTLTRPPLWRGVARPRMLLMPIVLPALGVLFQTIDTSRAKRAFDVIINDGPYPLQRRSHHRRSPTISRTPHPHSAHPPAHVADTPHALGERSRE